MLQFFSELADILIDQRMCCNYVDPLFAWTFADFSKIQNFIGIHFVLSRDKFGYLELFSSSKYFYKLAI